MASKGFGVPAGRLRHRITVQNIADSQDEIGGAVQTWSDAAKVWASIETLRGVELQNMQMLSPRVSHKIRLRYLSGFTERNRILFGDKIYHVEFINNVDKRNKVIECIVWQDKGVRGDGTTNI